MSRFSPIDLHKQLQTHPHVDKWWADRAIARVDWALEGYLAGYLTKEALDAERVVFTEEAERLLGMAATVSAIEMLRRRDSQTPSEREKQWLAVRQQREQLEAQRAEARFQRDRLKEGRRTLTDLRRHLRGQDASRPPVSGPAMSSRT